MADQEDSSPIRWPGLVALALAAIGGLFWVQSALHSSRPSSPPYREHRALGDQVVDARLWQDPFETAAAFQKAAGSGEEKTTPARSKGREAPEGGRPSEPGREEASPPPKPHTLQSVVAQMCRRMTNAAVAGPELLVSLQMVSGGPYPEDWEGRLRARNAVISALSRAGYVPFDEEHIDYFTVPWPRGARLEKETNMLAIPLTNALAGSLPLTIPFEWFQASELRQSAPGAAARVKQVLVCWLPREAFQDHPLKRLANLMVSLRPSAAAKASRVRYQLFDPELREMLEELKKPAFAEPKENQTNSLAYTNVVTNLVIYSAWSTTADALVSEKATGKRREAIQEALAHHGIAFANVAVTDDELAKRILEELKLRGVDLCQANQAVALIAEWDTYYGRALPLTFAAQVIQRRPGSTNRLGEIFETLHTNDASWPKNLLRFSYLRGVDGKAAGAEKEEKSGAPPKGGNGKEDLERPEGCSQLDYVPRLAAELLERDRDLRTGRNSGLKAIGVLGSDVYDKLLLIRALRDRFPGKLFFTVDLDARLLHSSELAWSRNLLVASGFDLELEPELQGAIPPFRDCYQTGRFLAGLAALGVVTNDLNRTEARMFEVGHHGAYVLDVSGNGASPFYSVRPPPLAWSRLGAMGTAALLAFLLLLMFSGRLRSWLACRSKPALLACRWAFLAAALLLLIGAVCVIRSDHERPDGEPFSLFEGISVWPAELIRLAAVFVGVGLLACQIRKLKLNTGRLRREFSLHDQADAKWISLSEAERDEFSRTHCCLPRCLAPFLIWRPRAAWDDEDDRSAKVKAEEMWRHYERWGRLRNRIARIVPAMLVFGGIAALLILPFGLPFRPVRGPVSDRADLIVLVAGVLTQVFLTFFVVDAVRACRSFIEALGSRATEWPPDLLEREALKVNMDHEYLDEWLDMDLIAQRTQEVGKLIYYPFIVLALMIVSRNTYFDRWDWPLSLVVVIGIISAYALSCAIGLRRAAEKARHAELGRLNTKLLAAIGKLDDHHPDQIRKMIEDLESLRKGVFAPLTEQPFFRATLIILGGAGSLPLAGYLPAVLGLLQ